MAEQESHEMIAHVPYGEYPVPSLAGVRGTVMFEDTRGHIHMAVDDGKITLSPTAGKTDLVLRTDVPGVLLDLVRGKINEVTAVLRGLVHAEGDMMLLIKIAGSMPDIRAVFRAQAPTPAGAE